MTRRRSRRSLVVPLLVGVAGLAVLAGAAHLALNWRSEQALERLEGDGEARERLADARVRGEALRQAELAEASALSVARSKLNRELARLDAARAAVSELRDARRRLDEARSTLLDGEPGRAAADDESLLTRAEAAFVATAELTGTPPEVAEERLDGLSDPLRAAEADLPAGYAPTPALGREIDAVAQEARERAGALASVAGLWENLAAEARDAPGGGETLRSALARRRQERDERTAQSRAEEIESARRENEEMKTRETIDADRKIALAAAAAEKARGDREAKRRILDAEVAEARATAEGAERRVKVARAKLEREFAAERPAADSLLAAFTADGDQYKGANAGAAKGPASLAAIRGLGALDDSEYGLRQMLFALHPGNNRRSGLDWVNLVMHLPPANWSHGQRTHIEETQRLLRKYGDLMVEKGLLAP